MLIYTAVASLAPLHRGRRGAPPDMLSGGGREILASYTAFRYQGNFSDVTCRLMDTLPHQSPAARTGGRKKLAGPKARTRKGADAEAGTQVEKVRCSNGDHAIYLLMTSEFAYLCVTDGFPGDSEAFAYLEVVEAAVSAAVAPLEKGEGEKVRKLASLALVESMNTWTSQANGGNLGPPAGRRSPGAGQVLPTGGYQSRTISPDLDGHAALKRCLVEVVRLLRVEKVEAPTVLRAGEGIESSTAEPVRSEVRTPRAQRPTPKGVLSPGPRGRVSRGNGIAGAGGDEHKSSRSPRTMVDGAGWVDRRGSSPSESLSSRSKQFKGLGTTGWNDPAQGTNSDGTGSASPSLFPGLRDPVPGIITAQGPLNTPAGQVSHPASQRERSRSPRTAHAHGGGDEPGGASPAATASPGADGILSNEPMAKSSGTLVDDLQSRLSLSVAQGHMPCLERAASMRNPQSTGWDFLSSTEDGQQRLRMATAPAGFTPPSSLPCPPVASPSAASAYLSHTAPHPHPHQHPHQQQQQWSPPSSAAATTLGHSQDVPGMLSGGPNSPQGNHHAVVGGALGPTRVWSTPTGNLGPLHLGAMDPGMMPPMSPPKPARSSSDPPSHVTTAAGSTGASDPKEYYAYRTTVAEERLRRRRLEGWEQQQREHQREQWRQQLGTAVDWEDGDGALSSKLGTGGGDDASPGCNSSGSASGGRSGSTQRQNPLTIVGRERGSSLGVGALGSTGGACSPTSSVTSGGVGSPFRQFERRPRSSPLRRWDTGEGENEVIKRASSCSQSPKRGANVVSAGRSTPPSAGTRNGRSESVPPRPRSWTGARSLGGSLTRPSTTSENDFTRDARSACNGGQQKLGILLPLDYSGMVPEEGAGEGMGDASLLRDLDVMAKNALRTQVEVSSSDDDLLTVLAKFRHTLLSIPLPPPAAVDYEQALKDAQRESIEVNGRLFNGDVEELLSKLRDQVEPLVPCDKTLLETVCQDIVRASSRTSSGGDTYAAMAALLLRPSEGDLLTPSGAESKPIGICLDTAKGEVVITVENSFLLRRDATDADGNLTPGKNGGGGGGGERGSLKERVVRKITARREAWVGHGWSVEGKQPEKYSSNGGEGATATASDEVAGIPLLGRLEVYLCLLDGSSKRRLKITCPTVEQCPPECSLLGAGVNEVNGTYELAGFRHGAPVYTKGKRDVTIGKEFIGGREGWIIGRPPNSVLYGQPVDTLLPPELHWALMNGGVGQDPPPTLMMHYNRRAKEKLIDIREMPTPRQHWAIGPHVTFPDRSEHNLVGSAIVVRPPTPQSPAGSRTPPRVPPATSLPIW